MQCEADHPKGCLVALGAMSACSQESKIISAPLAQAREQNREALLACVERGIALAQLPAEVDAVALATAYDSFLLGLSTLARDGLSADSLDAAVTRVMMLWDAVSAAPARKGQPPDVSPTEHGSM
ncbi:hypothetical protein D3C73_1381650 [compost metagenome]